MITCDIIPNDDVFRYFFYFMQERMNMFWHKCETSSYRLTKDPILKEYKFTNVYRACDRVSQYLIRNVIYKDINKYTPEDVLLRILIFKVFNKIETWEFLEYMYGDITICNFDVSTISSILAQRREFYPIFSNAYMMTGSHKKYDHLQYKHEKWLSMIKDEFIESRLLEKILKADSLEKIFLLLERCSFLGDFLSYQYTIDFNYSPYINFDENTFVKAGIGAIRGIKKCFKSYGSSYEEAIYYTLENIDKLREIYGYKDFRPLPNHNPTLIDIQNCFCETDKYLRAKMPELRVGNTKIKQKYKQSSLPIEFMFPPKWGVKQNLKTKCIQQSIEELMISW